MSIEVGGSRPDVDVDVLAGPEPRPLDEVVGRCARYDPARRTSEDVPVETAGDSARRTDGFVWIGLQQPRPKEIGTVAEQFWLPPLAVEDAVAAHQRPKLEVYGDVLFMVLKPVRYVDHDEVVEVSEAAIFVGEHFVVTVRHGRSDVLARVRAEMDGGSEAMRLGPIGVLYRTADLVVDEYERALAAMGVDVDEIECQVFGEDDADHSERIYKLKREVADFRRAVLPLGVPLQRLADAAVPLTDERAGTFFRDVLDHLLRATDAVESYDRLLSDVLQAHLSRVSVRQSQISIRQNEIAVRQNEDMRKISAWGAIALVPTAIAGIYGMNFDDIPELHWHYGYYAVLALIAVVCLLMHHLFRRNGWL